MNNKQNGYQNVNFFFFLFVARNNIAQFIVCDLGTETSICVFIVHRHCVHCS